jgi:hypothetical protein
MRARRDTSLPSQFPEDRPKSAALAGARTPVRGNKALVPWIKNPDKGVICAEGRERKEHAHDAANQSRLAVRTAAVTSRPATLARCV